MTERLKNLVRIPWAGIVTTNYDELIEYALSQSWNNGDADMPCKGTDSRLGRILNADSPLQWFLVKIHGTVSDPGNLVFGTNEYDMTYINTTRMLSFLTALMLRYQIVFLGCSLEGEILRLRRKLVYEFSGDISKAYALLPEFPENRQREEWLEEYAGVKSLLYPNDKGDYMGFDEFLEDAVECAEELSTAEG